MTATDPVVFLSYARTPMGSMQGSLSVALASDRLPCMLPIGVRA